MKRRSDLGWWGDHPYVYVAFTSGGALASWAFVLVAATTTPEAAIGFALCGGLFVVLLTIAAVYAWHGLLVGRHRDRVANDRMRWAWDKALLRAGWVFLWLIFLGLVVLTSVSFHISWRLDRYGKPAAAVVTAIHGTSITLAVTTPDGDRVGAWSRPRGSEPVAVGDRLDVVYDPKPGFNDVILADESPYAGASIPLAVGAVVAGMFVLVPAMRRRINRQALHPWSSDDGAIELPQPDRGRSQPRRRRRRRM